MCLALVLNNTFIQQKKENGKNILSFKNTVVATGSVIENFLASEQDSCDTWAKYINSNKMTIDEALALIEKSNTNGSISAQIVNLEDFTGKSTDISAENAAFNEGNSERYVLTSATYSGSYMFINVSYNDQYGAYAELRNMLSEMAVNDNTINVTTSYNNPLDSKKVIAFVRGVEIYDESGNASTMALLRILPASVFSYIWTLPSAYSDADVVIINENGKYISDTELSGHANFYEYIRAYNDISKEEAEEYMAEVNDNDAGYAIYDFENDTQMIVVYSRINTGGNDWHIISYIPFTSLGKAQFNSRVVIYVLNGVLILFFLDVFHLMEVNKQLKKNIKETKEANDAKTRFLSTMSHDIRTPMNAIIGMTTIAAKDLGNEKHVEECLKKISLSSNHLLTLINDILDISKIESGKYAVNPIEFSIADLTENIFNVVRQNIKAKDLTLNIHTHGIIHENLFADQLRLNQIYINILSNAVKYTNHGGVITVDIIQSPSCVIADGVKMVYRVKDTGIGMSREFMGRMYDSFARECDGRINTVQGTGLGLTITKQLVDMLGGTIEVESELGHGSTFTVTLDMPIAAQREEENTLPGVRMLVIDDDKDFLDSARETLSYTKAETDFADNAKTGLDLVRAMRKKATDYDVIILDWKMPEMSGLETLKAIRGEFGESIPVIIVSAYDYTEIEEDAANLGVNGFISKPLFNSVLCKNVRKILNMEEESSLAGAKQYDISNFNILIAEDNDMNYEIAECLLEDEGASCTRAENGKICVDMLEKGGEQKFDLVLMDMQMPVMKGIEATKCIRNSENEEIRDIPIIAMTADAFAENIVECRQAGMDGHIAKPIDMAVVLSEIQKVMKKRAHN
jgi:signal transduction histidine kinase/CheY-like chemotaxis protein